MARWIALTLIVLLAAVLAAFTIQNSAFESPLQLDLYFVAWQLGRPASVSALIWASFAAGFAIAGLWGLWRSTRLARRLRKLEQEIAFGGGKPKDDWTA